MYRCLFVTSLILFVHLSVCRLKQFETHGHKSAHWLCVFILTGTQFHGGFSTEQPYSVRALLTQDWERKAAIMCENEADLHHLCMYVFVCVFVYAVSVSLLIRFLYFFSFSALSVKVHVRMIFTISQTRLFFKFLWLFVFSNVLGSS